MYESVTFQDGYCSIKYDYLSEKRGHIEISWDSVGCDDLSASYAQNVAFFFCNLPDSELIMDITTVDLARLFVNLKNDNICIAKCLLSLPKDILRAELEAGLISQQYYDAIYLSVVEYLTLWNIIFKKWDYIKVGLKVFDKKLPFKTSLDFFKHIVAWEANSQFSNYLEKRYEDNPKVLKDIATLLRKEYRGETLTQKDISQLGKSVRIANPSLMLNKWEDRFRLVCLALAERDSDVRAFLALDAELTDRQCALMQNEACQGAKTYTWIEGWKLEGIIHRTAQGKLYRSRINKNS
ncbi:MAG: hypothetical protein QNJ42_06295 [Crocosphaera sp.]|nr:hypothetical protein [Crocosphaera sp.]